MRRFYLLLAPWMGFVVGLSGSTIPRSRLSRSTLIPAVQMMLHSGCDALLPEIERRGHFVLLAQAPPHRREELRNIEDAKVGSNETARSRCVR